MCPSQAIANQLFDAFPRYDDWENMDRRKALILQLITNSNSEATIQLFWAMLTTSIVDAMTQDEHLAWNSDYLLLHVAKVIIDAWDEMRRVDLGWPVKMPSVYQLFFPLDIDTPKIPKMPKMPKIPKLPKIDTILLSESIFVMDDL